MFIFNLKLNILVFILITYKIDYHKKTILVNIIKLIFSKDAKDFIYEQISYRRNAGLNKMVVVLFYHSGET
jgi:hypothetical protein